MTFIEDGVHLSNKACRHAYIGRSAGRCPCPSGRCWYQEQQTRRADGLKAIQPEHWPEVEEVQWRPWATHPTDDFLVKLSTGHIRIASCDSQGMLSVETRPGDREDEDFAHAHITGWYPTFEPPQESP